jgi:hypothetical protein
MTSQESAPLLGRNGSNAGSNTYYFQNSTRTSVSQSDVVRDQDGGLTVEQLPPGADAGDFEPRNIGAVTKVRDNGSKRSELDSFTSFLPRKSQYFSQFLIAICLQIYRLFLQQEKKLREPGFFGKIFGGNSSPNNSKLDSQKETKMVKPRKAPIKVEPKVFFANERTFLAWMHISILLAGASIAILAFSDYDDIGKQIYGLMTLPVAVAFIVYSMYQCKHLKIFLVTWLRCLLRIFILHPGCLSFNLDSHVSHRV